MSCEPAQASCLCCSRGGFELRLDRGSVETMSQTPPNDDNVKQSFEAAQLEKLNLEIRALRKERAWLDKLLQFLPAVTVLLALTGFLYGIFQASKAEQKARIAEQTSQKIKLQEQIRSDLDQIVRFPTDKNQTASRISFLLADLDKLFKTTLSDIEVVPKDERSKTSDILAQLISDDVDLNDRRNVDFAVTVLKRWDDYGAYLKSKPNLVMNILTNHCDALEEVYKKSPAYFGRFKYTDQTRSEIDEPKIPSLPSPTIARHFEDLVSSYSKYLELLQDPNSRQMAIKHFQAATCNKDLTQQEFGQSFDPKADASAFSALCKE